MVSGSRPGLSASHEGQYHAAASRRRTADPGNCRVDTRRHCKRGALRDRCLLHHRRAPRRRPQGTMDHRHERSPVRIQGSRLWDAPEHQGNVLRLQNPGLWHHPKPDRLERLIPVPAIAVYRAVSTGAKEEHPVAQRGEKRGPGKLDDPCVPSSGQACAPSGGLSRALPKYTSSGTCG